MNKDINLDDCGLPLWNCHKTVAAFKISEIQDKTLLSGEGYKVNVDEYYIERHKPKSGGYYMLYKDGYQSYSPEKAFEDGYTRIE